MLNKLYDLLSPLTNYPVIRAYENGREPPPPFLTYELKFEQTPEHALYGDVNAQGVRLVRTHVNALLELNYFGENSLSSLRELAMRLSTESVQNNWDEQGVAVVNVGRITHLAFLNEQGDYEDRAMLEVEIRYCAEITEQLGVIEQVTLTDVIGQMSGTQQIGVAKNGKN